MQGLAKLKICNYLTPTYCALTACRLHLQKVSLIQIMLCYEPLFFAFNNYFLNLSLPHHFALIKLLENFIICKRAQNILNYLSFVLLLLFFVSILDFFSHEFLSFVCLISVNYQGNISKNFYLLFYFNSQKIFLYFLGGLDLISFVLFYLVAN